MTKFKIWFAASAILVIVVAFQNCAQNKFEGTQNSESPKDSGNGGNYDGKISFVLMDFQQICSDGSAVRSQIDKITQSFFLVKENCLTISPRQLDISTVRIDPSGTLLTYNGTTYTKSRDPWLQPFSSASIWNTSIGSTVQWSSNNDADTIDLLTPGAGIAAGEWSNPFYLEKTTDSSKAVSSPALGIQNLHLPWDFQFSSPTTGNKGFVIIDASRRWMHQYSVCRMSSNGISCDYGIKDDTCGDGLGGFDLGRGMIRAWEIQSGEIKHALRFALPLNLLKASGVVWPARSEDFTEGMQGSAGNITYGSTIGIPANIDLSSLNLSAGGKILAKALQDYGAIQRDTSGTTGGVTFYAEEAAENLPQLAEMRSDLAKILPHLKIMRNQSPSTPQGGGIRRQPSLPGLDPSVCE